MELPSPLKINLTKSEVEYTNTLLLRIKKNYPHLVEKDIDTLDNVILLLNEIQNNL
jgi:hypothetical protein